jgi:hypothetical protein
MRNAVAGVLRYLSNYLGYDIMSGAFDLEDPPPNKVNVDALYRNQLRAHIFNCCGVYPT